MTLDHDTIEFYIDELSDRQIIFWGEILGRNMATGDWEELDKVIDVLSETRKKRCI